MLDTLRTFIYDFVINTNTDSRKKLLGLYLKVAMSSRLNKNIVQLDGVKIRLNENVFQLYNEIFVRKSYDFECSNDTPMIIDCGSNIGVSMLRFAKLYPKANIICFEPQPAAFDELSFNKAYNGLSNVMLNNLALSDIDGVIPFYVRSDLTMGMGAGNINHPGDLTKYVKSVKLSPYINKKIDLVKIDIEGFEYNVIRDLRDTEKLGLIDRIVMEYHHDGLYQDKHTFTLILSELERAGFDYLVANRHESFYPFCCLIKAWKPGCQFSDVTVKHEPI